VQTPYSVILMTFSGEITKMIPVSSQRQLTFFIPTSSEHTYFFDDLHLEIYHHDGQEKKISYGSLPIENSRMVTQVIRDHDMLCLITDGEVRLFRLEKNQG
ncbi:MAG: hypothetical protein OXC40_08040, partial [Proteobacteria bacterium]|nr:hypothetical protein [Pseudomonadota bacterium]